MLTKGLTLKYATIITIGLFLSLVLGILGAVFLSLPEGILDIFMPGRAETRNVSPDRDEMEAGPGIQWAQDGPPAPGRLMEADVYQPVITLTTAGEEIDPLRRAIRRGDVRAVRKMLAGEPDLVRGGKHRLPPLFEAVLTDSPEMVRVFLDAEADIKKSYSIDGKEIHTPLSFAVVHGKRNALFVLLDAGADAGWLVCAPEGRCGNVLSVAVLTGDATLVREMIVRGELSDRVINMRDVYAQYATRLSSVISIGKRIKLLPPLHTAARAGLADVAETLIALGADIDYEDVYNRTVENRASSEPVKRLLEAERKRAVDLVAAVRNGTREQVAAMIAAGANPNTAMLKGTSPLLAAIEAGDSTMVGILLTAGANPAKIVQGRTPLQTAVSRQRLTMVKQLFAAGGDPNERIPEQMPLFAEAVLSDNGKIVQAFLDAGASLTTRYKTDDREIHNILSYAASRGRPVSAALLARAGADPDWLACISVEICGNVVTLAAVSGDAQLLRDLIVEGRLSLETINLTGATRRDLGRLGGGRSPEHRGRRLLLPPLHAAARGNHPEAVEILLAFGADINHRDIAGRKAIDYAKGSELASLLEEGADGGLQTIDLLAEWAARGTNLAEAIEAGDSATVRELLAAGADPNAPASEQHMPPLLIAARTNNEGIVQILLYAGADIDLVYRDGTELVQTALSYAALEGHDVSARLLLRAGADPDRLACSSNRCGNVLTMAVLSGDLELVRNLVADGNLGPEHINLHGLGKEDIERAFPEVSAARWKFPLLPPLHAAYLTGNREMIELLLALGADRNRFDSRWRRASELARPYPRVGIDEHAEALVEAVAQGDMTKIVALLSSGTDPNFVLTDGRAPLPMAIDAGNVEIVRALLKGGADPERPVAQSSWHPLQLAIQQAYGDVVRVLLEYGADPNAIYRDDASEVQSALGDAIVLGHTEIALMLIDNGADTTTEYSRFESWIGSYLSLAALKGNEVLVRRLIEAGNEVSPQLTLRSREIYASVTPLIAAVWGDNAEIVALLLKKGAEVSTKNNYGCSAFDFAVINKRVEAIKILREAGGVADEAGCYMYQYMK